MDESLSDGRGGCGAAQEPAVVLATGVPRSGTTMLGELAVRYLHVAAINEGDFEIWLMNQAPSPATPLSNDRLDEVIQGLVSHPFFEIVFDGVLSGGRERPSNDEIVAGLRRRLPEATTSGIARATLWIAADHLGCPLAGHEDPHMHAVLADVLAFYPGARLIHIVRDPRDVACSVLRFPWGANSAVIAARDWERDVRRARAIGASMGDRYIEVRYEDLLQQPDTTMRRLMAFVGNVREHAVAHYVRETARNPRRDNFGNWRRDLSAQQLAGVESIAHDLMTELGYAPDLPRSRRSRWRESLWQLHHRLIQVGQILSGRLQSNGKARFIKNPERSPSERELVE